jgi:hypothetical protein
VAKLTKAEMVRQAIAAGHESPTAGVAWIRENHGVEVTPQAFSAYKAQEKERQERERQGIATPSADDTGNLGALVDALGKLVQRWGLQKVDAALTLWKRIAQPANPWNYPDDTDPDGNWKEAIQQREEAIQQREEAIQQRAGADDTARFPEERESGGGAERGKHVSGP